MEPEMTENLVVPRLRGALASERLSPSDSRLARQCIRRLEKPLRLILLGTDAHHAMQLLSLLSGVSMPVANGDFTRIQAVHSESQFAEVEVSDGTTHRIEPGSWDNIFDLNPVRVKFGLNTPALTKISVMVATDFDPDALAVDLEKSLPASDIALFAGGEVNDQILSMCRDMPVRLKDHSYLVLSPDMDAGAWGPVIGDFADAISVDPSEALAAKACDGGVDKEAFREAGGMALVKIIKREIEVLRQSALDAAELLLLRLEAETSDDQVQDTDDFFFGEDEEHELTPPAAGDGEKVVSASGVFSISTEIPSSVANDIVQPTAEVVSFPDGASARNSDFGDGQMGDHETMLRRRSTPGSKTNSGRVKSRPVSRNVQSKPVKVQSRGAVPKKSRGSSRANKQRPAATPWSMGL